MSTPLQFVFPLKPKAYGKYPIGTNLHINIDDLRGIYQVVNTANHGTILVIEYIEEPQGITRVVEFDDTDLKFKIPEHRVNPTGDIMSILDIIPASSPHYEQLETLKDLHTEHKEQRKLGAIDDDITDGIIDILDGLFGITQDEATAIDEAKGG